MDMSKYIANGGFSGFTVKEKNSRRSSILKPPNSRKSLALGELNSNTPDRRNERKEKKSMGRRRVSFAAQDDFWVFKKADAPTQAETNDAEKLKPIKSTVFFSGGWTNFSDLREQVTDQDFRQRPVHTDEKDSANDGFSREDMEMNADAIYDEMTAPMVKPAPPATVYDDKDKYDEEDMEDAGSDLNEFDMDITDTYDSDMVVQTGSVFPPLQQPTSPTNKNTNSQGNGNAQNDTKNRNSAVVSGMGVSENADVEDFRSEGMDMTECLEGNLVTGKQAIVSTSPSQMSTEKKVSGQDDLDDVEMEETVAFGSIAVAAYASTSPHPNSNTNTPGPGVQVILESADQDDQTCNLAQEMEITQCVPSLLSEGSAVRPTTPEATNLNVNTMSTQSYNFDDDFENDFNSAGYRKEDATVRMDMTELVGGGILQTDMSQLDDQSPPSTQDDVKLDNNTARMDLTEAIGGVIHSRDDGSSNHNNRTDVPIGVDLHDMTTTIKMDMTEVIGGILHSTRSIPIKTTPHVDEQQDVSVQMDMTESVGRILEDEGGSDDRTCRIPFVPLTQKNVDVEGRGMLDVRCGDDGVQTSIDVSENVTIRDSNMESEFTSDNIDKNMIKANQQGSERERKSTCTYISSSGSDASHNATSNLTTAYDNSGGGSLLDVSAISQNETESSKINILGTTEADTKNHHVNDNQMNAEIKTPTSTNFNTSWPSGNTSTSDPVSKVTTSEHLQMETNQVPEAELKSENQPNSSSDLAADTAADVSQSPVRPALKQVSAPPTPLGPPTVNPISVHDFLSLAQTHFMDNLVTRRRTTMLAGKLVNIQTFTDKLRVACTLEPKLTLLEQNCSMLDRMTEETRAKIQAQEKKLDIRNPTIFQALRDAGGEDRASMRQILGEVKQFSRLEARKMWASWRLQAENRLAVMLEQKVAHLEQERHDWGRGTRDRIRTAIADLNSLTEALRQERVALGNSIMSEKDYNELENTFKAAVDQNTAICSFESSLHTLNDQRETLYKALGELQDQQIQIKTLIDHRSDELVRKQAKLAVWNRLTPADIDAMQSDLHLVLKLQEWYPKIIMPELVQFSLQEDAFVVHVRLGPKMSASDETQPIVSVTVQQSPQSRDNTGDIVKTLLDCGIFDAMADRYTESNQISEMLEELSFALERVRYLAREIESLRNCYKMSVIPTAKGPSGGLDIHLEIIRASKGVRLRVIFSNISITNINALRLNTTVSATGPVCLKEIQSVINTCTGPYRRMERICNKIETLLREL
eukprot:CFRG3102T1